MFHFHHGLKLTEIDLAIDVRRRQPRGFISHAHADHMARHELTFCTPETAMLCRHRLGSNRFFEMPFERAYEWGGLRLTTYPAGHVLGAAMLLADDGKRRLLYTGDFKLRESATVATAHLPTADVLIMESTFGDPRYRLPPRRTVIQQLLDIVHSVLARDATPVIHAYTFGKAQEVTKILTNARIPVLQHRLAYEISRIYEACGCDLGPYALYETGPRPGHAVIAPPRTQRAAPLVALREHASIAVTGWAIDPRAHVRLGVDYALPLSDHADYDELFEAVDRVMPDIIYCTHGPHSFVDRLRDAGHNAYPLGRAAQLRLF